MGTMLLSRDTLFPNEVVAVYLDKMNDPHPQLRSIAQSRTMLVLTFCFRTNQYLRLMSNLGWARSEEELWLRDTHFPNEVLVKTSDTPDFTSKYVKELNTPPGPE